MKGIPQTCRLCVLSRQAYSAVSKHVSLNSAPPSKLTTKGNSANLSIVVTVKADVCCEHAWHEVNTAIKETASNASGAQVLEKCLEGVEPGGVIHLALCGDQKGLILRWKTRLKAYIDPGASPCI